MKGMETDHGERRRRHVGPRRAAKAAHRDDVE